MSTPDPLLPLKRDLLSSQPDDSGRNKRPTKLQNRSLKACDYCRLLKTKCLKANKVSVSCVRCMGANKVCLLELEYRSENPHVRLIQGVPEHLVEKDTLVDHSPFSLNLLPSGRNGTDDMKQKLDLIYLGVSEILSRMRRKPQDTDPDSILNSDVKLLLDAASSMKRAPQTPSALDQPPLHELTGNTHRFGLPSTVGTPLLTALGQLAGPRLGMDDQDEPDDELFLASEANSFRTSPFSVVSHTVSDVPRPIMNLLNLSTLSKGSKAFFEVEYDMILSGILSVLETVDLMKDFRSNYGRWVSFPLHVSTDELVVQIRHNSSLLLTTCCALSLRYSLNGKPSPGDMDNHRRKKDTYKLVMRQLVCDLDKALLKYSSFQGSSDNSGDIEFLQAIVILSIYLLLLSSIVANTVDPESLIDDDVNLRNLNLDPWYLSGLGLQTFISKLTFGSLVQSNRPRRPSGSPFTVMFDVLDSSQSQMLTVIRIYNHMILIHLVSCVLSGRMCVVDEIRLNYCMSALSLPSATNFDGRMVSEISILLIAYNFIQMNLNSPSSRTLEQLILSLQQVEEEINQWYEQWLYLFSQPALQFVEFCYNFCYIQIYISYTFAKIEIASKVSRKLPDFMQINELELLDPILAYADKDSIIKIMKHSLTLVGFISTVTDDSYFAYLSDQVHFFFFFGGLVTMKALSFLKNNDKLHYLNECDCKDVDEKSWRHALDSVKLLIDKFDRVAQDNTDDVITKYKNGLLECLELMFPGNI